MGSYAVCKLVDGVYRLQIGELFWMPEVGLGIGRFEGVSSGEALEMLGWFDRAGKRYLTPEERAAKAERLAARLRELGEDPELI